MQENLNGFVFKRMPKQQPHLTEKAPQMEINGFVFKLSTKPGKGQSGALQPRISRTKQANFDRNAIKVNKENLKEHQNKKRRIKGELKDGESRGEIGNLSVHEKNLKDEIKPEVEEQNNCGLTEKKEAFKTVPVKNGPVQFAEPMEINLLNIEPEKERPAVKSTQKVKFIETGSIKKRRTPLKRVPTPYKRTLVPINTPLETQVAPPNYSDSCVSLREPTVFTFKKDEFALQLTEKAPFKIPDDFTVEEKIRCLLTELVSDSFLSIELSDLIRTYKYVDPYEALVRDYKNLIEEYKNDCAGFGSELKKWADVKAEIWSENVLDLREPTRVTEDFNLEQKMADFDKEMESLYGELNNKRKSIKKGFEAKKICAERLVRSIFETMKKENRLDPILLLKAMSKM